MTDSWEEQRRSSTEKIMKYANDTHGINYSVIRRLGGGFAGEPYLISDTASGRNAVLKWDKRTEWAETVDQVAPVVAQATRAGWPTPEWLFQGVTPSGIPYVIQDFVPLTTAGDRVVTCQLAKAAVDFVQRTQAGIRLDTEVNWLARDHAVVFAQTNEYKTALRQFSDEGARLVDLIEDWVKPFQHLELSADDIVHGDFQSANLFLSEGCEGREDCKIAAVVDVEALGKGTRFRDLADLAGHNIIWQGERGVFAVLDQYAKKHARPGEWEISLSARFLMLLWFYVVLFKGLNVQERLRQAICEVEYAKGR